MDLASRDRRRAGRARARRSACGAHLFGGRYRRRSALPGARHVAAGATAWRHGSKNAGDRAEAVGHAGRSALARAVTRRAYKQRAWRTGFCRRRHRAAAPRRSRAMSDQANATFDKLIVQEVAPRDGLQIEPSWVDTADKIALIDALSTFGFKRIEGGSFVSPKAIPALRDGDAVFQQIKRQPGVIYVALIPNLKGAERALASRADELNLVMSASQTHNRANMRMSCESSLAAFDDIVRHVKGTGVLLNASVATAFGCPFEGKIDEDRVIGIVDTYREMGIEGVTLADTTGMANPRQVARIVTRVLERMPASALTLHFHN